MGCHCCVILPGPDANRDYLIELARALRETGSISEINLRGQKKSISVPSRTILVLAAPPEVFNTESDLHDHLLCNSPGDTQQWLTLLPKTGRAAGIYAEGQCMFNPCRNRLAQ